MKEYKKNVNEPKSLTSKQNYSMLIDVFLLTISILGVFSIYLLTDNVADSDSLYHIRHAWLYRNSNLFDSSFPWHQFSVVKDAASDLWYGFHILLLPFTYVKDLLIGIKTSGIAISVFLIFSLYLVFRKIKVWQPAIWVLFFISTTSDTFYRMTTNRPHVVSMALIALLFIFACQRASRRKWFLIGIPALISSIHIAMAWAVPLVVFVGLMSEGIIARRGVIVGKFRTIMKNTMSGTALAILGIVIGFLLRPNPLGVLKLFYVQTFGIVFAKIDGQLLPFGFELEKLDFYSVFMAWVFFIVLFVALITFIKWHNNKQSMFFKESLSTILGSLALCLFFLFLSIFVARRAMDFVFFFGIIFISIILSEYLNDRPIGLEALIEKAGIVILITFFAISNMGTALSYKEKYAHDPDIFKDAALWLETNSNKGDVVTHFNFLDAPKLFFWNQKNYYITGFDPIFQYSFDKQLYSYLEFSKYADVPSWFGKTDSNYNIQQYIIASATRNRKRDSLELYQHLTNDFKAKYLFMEKRFYPSLMRALNESSGFEKRFETDDEVIYRVIVKK